jgi:hypothetical protein
VPETEVARWIAREKAQLTNRPIEELTGLLYQCGQEVGSHDGEPEHERSYSVDLAMIKAAAIKEIIVERMTR